MDAEGNDMTFKNWTKTDLSHLLSVGENRRIHCRYADATLHKNLAVIITRGVQLMSPIRGRRPPPARPLRRRPSASVSFLRTPLT